MGVSSGSLVLNSLEESVNRCSFNSRDSNRSFSSLILTPSFYFSNPYLNYIFEDVDNCGQNLAKGMIEMVYCYKPLLKKNRSYLI